MWEVDTGSSWVGMAYWLQQQECVACNGSIMHLLVCTVQPCNFQLVVPNSIALA